MKLHQTIMVTSSFLVSCGYLQRHPESGYGEHNPHAQERRLVRHSQSEQLETISNPRLSSLKHRLQNLENSLNTKKEVEQYSKMLPYFKSDEERVDFLSQGGFEEKQVWLNQNDFLRRPQRITDDMKELIDVQDITMGMPQVLVKKSWGEPDSIEVSGNPAFRNERWRYHRYISSSEGYRAEKKVVYFEGGRVTGWELE